MTVRLRWSAERSNRKASRHAKTGSDGLTSLKVKQVRIVLFILSVVALFFGFVFLSAASTAVGEIQAFILFVVAAVLLSGASIIDSLITLRKDLSQVKPSTSV